MGLLTATRCFAPMCAGALILTTAASAQDFDSVEIVATDLGNGIYMMTGRGGNLGVSIGDEGAFLIDDQFAPLSEKILAAIAALSDGPVRYVLNTHWHGDHTGGNENLSGAGATIVAHENVRTRMSADQVTLFGATPASPPEALPAVTFTDGASFHINGQTIRAIHVANAHTDGDVVIHLPEANVIHAGDVFFNGLFPFIDALNGGTVDGMIDALEVVLDLARDDTRIIPGHGPLGTKADAVKARDDLVAVRDAIRPLVDLGMPEDEIVAGQPLSGLDLNADGGFFDADAFVRIVISGLAAG